MSEQDTRRGSDPAPIQEDGSPRKRDPDEVKRDKVEQKRMMKAAGRYSFIGIEFGVSVVIGYLVGDWLDDWLGTQPWLTLTFIFFGLASASRDLFRLVKRAKREQANEHLP